MFENNLHNLWLRHTVYTSAQKKSENSKIYSQVCSVVYWCHKSEMFVLRI